MHGNFLRDIEKICTTKWPAECDGILACTPGVRAIEAKSP